MFNLRINCSVPENGEPFLFDVMEDVPVISSRSLIRLEGDIKYLGFFKDFQEASMQKEEGSPWIVGRCFTTIGSEYYYVVGRAAEEAGTAEQLYKSWAPR